MFILYSDKYGKWKLRFIFVQNPTFINPKSGQQRGSIYFIGFKINTFLCDSPFKCGGTEHIFLFPGVRSQRAGKRYNAAKLCMNDLDRGISPDSGILFYQKKARDNKYLITFSSVKTQFICLLVYSFFIYICGIFYCDVCSAQHMWITIIIHLYWQGIVTAGTVDRWFGIW